MRSDDQWYLSERASSLALVESRCNCSILFSFSSLHRLQHLIDLFTIEKQNGLTTYLENKWDHWWETLTEKWWISPLRFATSSFFNDWQIIPIIQVMLCSHTEKLWYKGNGRKETCSVSVGSIWWCEFFESLKAVFSTSFHVEMLKKDVEASFCMCLLL